MRIAKSAIIGSLFAGLLAGLVMSDKASAADLRQPSSIRQTAFEYDNYLYFAPPEEPSQSPSDAPVTEEPASRAAACAPACQPAFGRPCGRARRGRRCCDPWTLPQPRALQCRGIRFGGWVEGGITAAANMPADRFNGVVTFNDRDGEGLLNQMWFYLDREVDTGGYGWDIGGRIDFVYGTDAFFTQAVDGLEANWNQNEPYYQAALPQMYVDVGYNDWTFRIGHFFTIIGYESVAAPENFFYSHAYTMQYGEPFTHTGMLAIYQVTDRLAVSGGFHRGWNSFDDTIGKDSLGFLGGINWVNWNERVELAAALTASEELAVDASVLMYSLVATLHLSDDLRYVVQHDYGQGVVPGVSMAEWYGLNQYFLYDLSDRWAAGLRFEWFRDHDGTRVQGVRPNNVLNGASFPGSFYEISLGLNWKPRTNIVVRPEVRWDWTDASEPGTGRRPYDSGDQASQFLFGCDLIWTY